MKIFSRIRASSLTPASYLFASVVFLRLIALLRLSASPFLLPSRGDMHFYNDWAQRILRGEWTDHFAFYGLPLYAYVLAAVYALCGYSPFVPALLQAILDGGTAVLIYRITLRVYPPELLLPAARSTITLRKLIANRQPEVAGTLAALGWAFFVPAEVYSVILMPSAWLVFIFWFVVWRILRKDGPPSPKECAWLGLLIGFTAMGVATILFLLPLVVAALFIKDRIDNRTWRVSAGTALLILGVTLGTSPCWIHNYFVARDPVLLSAHSGVNFWIGNNPEANGYPRFPPGLRAGQTAMLEDSISAAESAAGHPLKRAQVSAYWSAKARDYIAHHFGDWLKLLAKKFRNFWCAFQYDDLSIITTLREEGVVFPGIYFGLVAAFSLPGFFLAWRRAPASRWIALAILLHMCALLPVFVTERYRLPIVPGLLVFATIGLSILWQSWMTVAFRRVALYLALLAASTIFISWPQRNPSLWALDAYNSGWQALQSNNLALAEKKLSLARAYVPDNAETNFALGNLRLAQGDPEKARTLYRTVLQIDPRHKGAFNNLGVLALQAGNFPEAHACFEHALSVAPRDAKTHYLLAKTFRAEGSWSAAKDEIEKALELNPWQREFTIFLDEIRNAKER